MRSVDRKVILAAAWLDTLGLTQQEISERLGTITQSTVSRHIATAEREGWTRSRMLWPEDVSDEDSNWILSHGYNKHSELFKKLNARAIDRGHELSSLHIVPGRLSPGPQDGDRGALLKAFGLGAAAEIETYVRNARAIAIAWGRTISAVLDEVTYGKDKDDKLELVFPVAGEPTNFRNLETGSSEACRRLARRLEVKDLALDSVPARIWKHQLVDPKAETYIRNFIAESRAYTSIFIAPDPLVEDVDLILVGAGNVGTSIGETGQGPADPWVSETTEAEEITPEDLDRIAVGNLGGVWLPKRDATAEDRQKVEGINNRWLGIKRFHLEACAKRSRVTGVPGVICVAAEPEKANVVLESMGLVSRLIISAALADALLGRLGE